MYAMFIFVLPQNINEEQPATNQEYLDTFEDIFDWSQNTRGMIGQGDSHLNSLGLESVIMKSDSDNLIIKYAVDDKTRANRVWAGRPPPQNTYHQHQSVITIKIQFLTKISFLLL